MVFILSALQWIRIRGLGKLLDGRDRLRGKQGLVLTGGTMHSKSLIQFSVDGPCCVPSLLFDLRPNYGGGNEDSGDLLQKIPLLHSVPLTLQQATANPHLHWRLLDIHWQVLVSLLWDHGSFLFGSGGHQVVFETSKSLFPQSCVISYGSLVGLIATSSNRAYATSSLLLPEPLVPAVGHC